MMRIPDDITMDKIPVGSTVKLRDGTTAIFDRDLGGTNCRIKSDKHGGYIVNNDGLFWRGMTYAIDVVELVTPVEQSNSETVGPPPGNEAQQNDPVKPVSKVKPLACPDCGTLGAYIGHREVECPNWHCARFSAKQADIEFKRQMGME